MVGPAVGVSPDSRTPRRSCRSCPVHSSPATPDGPWSHIADTSAPVDAAAGCRRDSAGSPAAPRWRRPRRAALMHRAPHPAWPYFSSVLDRVANVMYVADEFREAPTANNVSAPVKKAWNVQRCAWSVRAHTFLHMDST